MAHFYTYSIKNIDTGKFYIGSRTAKCMLNRKPEDDLGVKYFSSSTDKELRQAIKDNRVEYHVLQEYDDAKVCWSAEQQLIAFYWKFFGKDRSYNHFYSNYNGDRVFSAAGTHKTEEQKKAQSEKVSGENNGMFGKHHTEESINRMKENHKGLNTGEKHPLYGIGHKPESIEKMKQAKANKSKEEKEAISEKRRQTLLEKYGVECVSQIPGIGEKISNAKKGKSHAPISVNVREKMSKSQKGKPKPKFYWQTPEGEIKTMDKANVQRFHPDWILIRLVEK